MNRLRALGAAILAAAGAILLGASVPAPSRAVDLPLPPLLEGLGDAETVRSTEDALRRLRRDLLEGREDPGGQAPEPDAEDAEHTHGHGPAPRSGRSQEARAPDSRRFTRAEPQAPLPDTQADRSDTAGRTGVEQRIDGDPPGPGSFSRLGLVEGDGRIVREELAPARDGREERRRSIVYLGQLSDFQLVDTQSPARVEFIDVIADQLVTAFSAAWRPQEATVAHGVDQAIRQMNRFVEESPHPQGDGTRAEMALALMTGDLADNMQLNETANVVTLLEGGVVDPNSGSLDPDDYRGCPPGTPGPEAARGYVGVQDYSVYSPAGLSFYDPDRPAGRYSSWPSYPGLMDQAQRRFTTPGLRVPSYVVFGNHDGLVQGNQWANLAFEEIAVGCVKPLLPAVNPTDLADALDPDSLQAILSGNLAHFMLVPPDPRRQFVDKRQFKALHATGRQADAHGFALVDPDELEASNGAASYYAWDPIPGLRMIGLDTLSVGGIVGDASNGNIANPQFEWLRRELEAAQAEDKLIVVFGHHPIRSLTSAIPHEAAPPCIAELPHRGHDINAGCRIDPRPSTPIRQGDDLRDLLLEFPNAIAYVAGHTHEQTVSHFEGPGSGASAGAHDHGDGSRTHTHAGDGDHDHGEDGDMRAFRQGAAVSGGFWGIETASLIDWPPQSRLIEVMNNCDGTLSILGTVLDTEAPSRTPDPGTPATGFGVPELAAVGRELSFNDPQAGRGYGDGEPQDRNVELLIGDPRAPEASARECEAAETPGTTREPAAERAPSPAATGLGGEGPGAGRGRLPLTGLLLLPLLVAGLALLSGGRLAERWAGEPGSRLERLRALREDLPPPSPQPPSPPPASPPPAEGPPR